MEWHWTSRTVEVGQITWQMETPSGCAIRIKGLKITPNTWLPSAWQVESELVWVPAVCLVSHSAPQEPAESSEAFPPQLPEMAWSASIPNVDLTIKQLTIESWISAELQAQLDSEQISVVGKLVPLDNSASFLPPALLTTTPFSFKTAFNQTSKALEFRAEQKHWQAKLNGTIQTDYLFDLEGELSWQNPLPLVTDEVTDEVADNTADVADANQVKPLPINQILLPFNLYGRPEKVSFVIDDGAVDVSMTTSEQVQNLPLQFFTDGWLAWPELSLNSQIASGQKTESEQDQNSGWLLHPNETWNLKLSGQGALGAVEGNHSYPGFEGLASFSYQLENLAISSAKKASNKASNEALDLVPLLQEKMQLSIELPWQLDISTFALSSELALNISLPEQQLSAKLEGPVNLSETATEAALALTAKHPALKHNQTDISATFEHKSLRYQAGISGAGAIADKTLLADSELSYQTQLTINGDTERVVAEFAQLSVKHQHPELPASLDLAPGAQLSWHRGLSTLEANGKVLHPYGEGRFESQLNADQVADKLHGTFKLTSRADLTQADFVLGSQWQLEAKVGEAVSAPTVVINRLIGQGELKNKDPNAPKALSVGVWDGYLSKPLTVYPINNSEQANIELVADKVRLGRDAIPMPKLSAQLLPFDLQQPIQANADFANVINMKTLQTGHGQLFVEYSPKSDQVNWRAEQVALAPYGHLIDPVLLLSSGNISGEGKATGITQSPVFEGQMHWLDIAGDYTGILFNGITGQAQFTGKQSQSGVSVDAEGDIRAASLFPGIPISDMSSNWQLKLAAPNKSAADAEQAVEPVPQLVARLTNVQANVLDGQAYAPQITYPATALETVTVTGLDLSGALAMQESPVVDLRGRVNMSLPMMATAQGVRVENGRIVNRDTLFVKVNDPSVIDQYAAANPAFALVLENLKQMQIGLLSADVSMENDGEALIKATVHGKNPNQTRPIHLNYSHEENLFDLLKSLRMSDSFRQQIEEQLNQSQGAN
ncbi:hypothetical protein GCM10025776_02250 [Corallincola platygyrae]